MLRSNMLSGTVFEFPLKWKIARLYCAQKENTAEMVISNKANSRSQVTALVQIKAAGFE
jgi:hypothetical protein